jgi:outer membrane protein
MKLFISLFLIFITHITYSQQKSKTWTLEECVAYAIENNISIKQSKLRSNIQEVEVKRAKMDFLPSLSGSIAGDYSFGKPDKVTNPNSFTNTYGISSNLVLYNGNRNIKNLEKTKNNLIISDLESREIQDDITLRVVSAYLNILYNEEGVKIAKEQVKIGENLVIRMQGLVDTGIKAKNDLFQVQANLAVNEENLVTAKNNLDLSLLDLAQILQISHKGFNIKNVSVTIDTAKLFFNNSEIIYEKALKWRPEIESAKMSIKNSDLDYAIAKSGILPTVSASYRFGSIYMNTQNLVNQSGYFKQLVDNRGHTVGLSINIPIFDKLSTSNNIERVKIQREIATYSLENEIANLRATVERAYIDAKTSLKTFEATKKSVEAQEEAFRTAQERYNLGVLTSFDFDQVRNQLINAKSSFIRAKYNFIFKTKFLEFYYGMPIKLNK